MNLWRRFLNAIRWKPESRVYISSRQAGVRVNEDTAKSYSAVAACVRIISETLASLPWCTYQKLASGGRVDLSSHPVTWLLGFQPNPEQTAMVWRRQKIAHYLLWGNGYSEIERGMDGRAVWLWPLLPDRSEIKRSETGALVCEVRTNQGTFVLPRDDVYHLADGSYDGLMGESRIQLARRAIGAGIAQDVFTSSFYQNGAHVGGVIEQKQGKTLSPDGQKALLKSFNEEHAGPDRARKTLYLDAGMEYTPLTMPLTDAQFIESRRFSVEEICRWFGVPQHLVQMLIETNYAISYTADKNFVEHTLRPIATLMEQEANLRLFGARARGAVYTKINLNALMRGDPKVRGEYYKTMVNAGVMSINEVRELEELNSIGPEGDEHYLGVNMTTLGRIASGENVAKAAPAQPAAEPAQEPAAADQPSENIIRRDALAWWHNGGKEQAHG